MCKSIEIDLQKHALFLKIMKMTLSQLVILLIMTGISVAASSNAQEILDKKVTLDARNQNLKEILRQIESKAGVKFAYSKDAIRSIEAITIRVVDEKLSDVLDKLLSPRHIRYQVIGEQIILNHLPAEDDVHKSEESSAGKRIDEIVTGKVSDEAGSTIPGVNVILKGTTLGTVTDVEGNYSLAVPDLTGTLIFSYIGYVAVEMSIQGRTTLDVTLAEDVTNLDEIVVVGYGTQKKTSVTAAVSTLDGEEIAASPVGNLSNTIAGRMPGIIVRQVSGQPGNDQGSIYIRGIATTGSSAPLIIVDGVPREFSQLDPNSIASVTVLKDAAAVAPYGVAGANGVLLVTTKRGSAGKPTIRYNGYYGIQNPTFLPDYVNLEQFAALQNRIASNAGNPPPWDEERLQRHLSGSDPDRYPNWDVFDALVEKNAPITNHNVEISGGDENVKYYTSLGYQRQNGMWETDYQNKYAMVINLDARVTNTTKVSLSINGNVRKHTQPAVGERVNQGAEYIMQLFSYAHPNLPLFFSNGTYGTYVTPAILASGYKNTDVTTVYTMLSIEQELPFVPGLKFKSNIAYDPTTTYIKAWQLPTHVHTLDVSKDPYEFIDGVWGAATPSLNETYRKSSQITWQGSFDYAGSFGKHNVSALTLFETKEVKFNTLSAGRKNYSLYIDELNTGSSAAADISNSGLSSQARQMGLVYRITYDFDSKYLFETTGRYDGHYYFAPGKKWGFFPSVALGWRISEEDFLSEVNWIDNLKIRASYGEVGALAGSPFQYLSTYSTYGPAYAFGGSAGIGIRERSEANRNITWERAQKKNIGLEVNLWNGHLNMELDYFYEKRSNMLVTPNVVVPSEYGIGLSQVNSGVMENKGIDLAIGSTHEFSNDLSVSLNGTFTYARNKLLEVFETASTYDNPNRRITGRPLGTQFGYDALGYFSSADFEAGGALKPGIASQPWGPLLPGDIRYRDVNDDGQINDHDIVPIGRSRIPEIIYGISPSVTFKGFSLNLLFQGASNADFRLHGAGAWPFWGNRAAYASHLDNWTPENPDARYPRLVAGQTANNSQPSDWWVEDTSYLRLKSGTIGYTLPAFITEAIKIQSANIYVSGQNMYTWTKVINWDPELNNSQSWDYPQQQVFSVGANITF